MVQLIIGLLVLFNRGLWTCQNHVQKLLFSLDQLQCLLFGIPGMSGRSRKSRNHCVLFPELKNGDFLLHCDRFSFVLLTQEWKTETVPRSLLGIREYNIAWHKAGQLIVVQKCLRVRREHLWMNVALNELVTAIWTTELCPLRTGIAGKTCKSEGLGKLIFPQKVFS